MALQWISVQEAFISLHKSYADKATEEWYPLFYTILTNKLQDWRRKEARRAQPFSLFKKVSLDDDDIEQLDIVDEQALNPAAFLDQAVTVEEIQAAIAKASCTPTTSIYASSMGRL